jgi:hypothetical protein
MIDLSDVPFRTMEPMMPDLGVLQEPILEGPATKINRIGGGFVITAMLPTMPMEPGGRLLIADLQQAKRQGVIIGYDQVGFKIGTPGSPTVDGAIAGGTTLAITGATPRYVVRKGQALNVTKASKRYLYFAAAQSVLDGSGAGDILLTTPLRTMLAGGEAVNFSAPVVEGWITSDLSWPIDLDRTTGLSIRVRERG